MADSRRSNCNRLKAFGVIVLVVLIVSFLLYFLWPARVEKQEVKEEALKQKFSSFGKVVDCFNPGKGFAFVTFETLEEAKSAMDGLNGTEYNGNKLSINVSKPKEKQKEKKKDKKKKMKAADIAERFSSESSRVFVKNIEKDADVDEVRKLFETHGTVKDVYNPGKGYAFVR